MAGPKTEPVVIDVSFELPLERCRLAAVTPSFHSNLNSRLGAPWTVPPTKPGVDAIRIGGVAQSQARPAEAPVASICTPSIVPHSASFHTLHFTIASAARAASNCTWAVLPSVPCECWLLTWLTCSVAASLPLALNSKDISMVALSLLQTAFSSFSLVLS